MKDHLKITYITVEGKIRHEMHYAKNYNTFAYLAFVCCSGTDAYAVYREHGKYKYTWFGRYVEANELTFKTRQSAVMYLLSMMENSV